MSLLCLRFRFSAVLADASGVLLQSQRDGEPDWMDHGVKTDNVFVDTRAPLEANKPEVRRYRQIYVKNDQPVGLWSDVVRVTVQP